MSAMESFRACAALVGGGMLIVLLLAHPASAQPLQARLPLSPAQTMPIPSGSFSGPSFVPEMGFRSFFSFNSVVAYRPNEWRIDLVKHLQYSESYLLGELCTTIRNPRFAFTYSFTFPRTDDGVGVLTGSLTPDLEGPSFAAGSKVSWSSTISSHRLDWVIYVHGGPGHRIGPLLMVEIRPMDLTVRTASPRRKGSTSLSRVLLGVGGELECALLSDLFVRFRGAYEFNTDYDAYGTIVEAEAKWFLDLTHVVRPYLSAGYRYKLVDTKLQGQATRFRTEGHGPMLTFGWVF